MSRQLWPRPTSATMGMENSATCSISCWTRVLEFFGFGGDDVEEEFVVDLEGHAGAEFAAGDGGVDADHGELDEVGGGALQRGVDGGALGEAAHVGVARLDVGDGADAAEVGADGLVAADGLEGLVDEAADAGVAVEVGLDVELALRSARCRAARRGRRG